MTACYRFAMGRVGALARRVRELHPTVADGLLAGLVTAIALPSLWIDNTYLARLGFTFRRTDALAVLLLLVEMGVLTWRRRAPLLVLLVAGSASFTYGLIGYRPTQADLALFVAIYTVGAQCPPRRLVGGALAFAAGVALYGILTADRYGGASVQDWVLSYLVFLVAWMLGNYQRDRRAAIVKLQAMNTQLAREQELKARWAVAEEKARIARELHDVVAHSVSVMTVQAGAARRVVEVNPGQAMQAMTSIEATGRQALVELRRLLGVLRRDDDGGGELTPQPSLGHVDLLIDGARDAGLTVDLEIQGVPRPLAAGVDLSAFRIVQEALTNTLKHAGPATALVRLCYGERELELQVLDDGRGMAGWRGPDPDPERGTGGNGLIGMRERVALFGGALEVGPRPGGGFLVDARLPLEGGDVSAAGTAPDARQPAER